MVKLTVREIEQIPTRKGRQERIAIKRPNRPSRNLVTRTYNPSTNDWVYTAVGRQFYSRIQSRYVVIVPVTHRGTRSSGQPYTRENTFPLREPVNLPFGLSVEQRDERIKTHVLQMFPGGVIGQYSDEEIVIRPEGAFSITEMVTAPDTERDPQTEVITREL
jgi:hypothetical protein